MRLLSLLFLGLVCCIASPLRAQDSASTPVVADSATEVRLKDGSVLIGRVESETATQVVLITRSGARVEIPRGEIVSMRRILLRGNGEAWAPDANGSRLFFSATGRPVPKGEGYVSAFWLFFPFVGYGVTDRFTIAGGTPIVPGAIGRVFYLAPKYTVLNRGNTSFSVGTLSFFVTEEIDEGNAGILYGAGTYGSGDNAITLGAGWFYAAGDGWSGTSNEPVFMLGGERRISRRVKLITENWLSVNPGVNGVISGGFRFLGDRLSADLGFAGVTGVEAACCLPLINFVWSFGGTGGR